MERRTRGVRTVDNATNQCNVLAVQADTTLFAGARGCNSCGQPLGMRAGEFGLWDAFPAGVKFDPSDEELLMHLAAEMGSDNARAHPFIKNFISVLEGEEGICQTHPENLPGVKKDGSSKHFFHRPTKAYTTGTRKRRKIQSEDDEPGVETRWHKTGKTRSVIEDGRILGWKKIMVLYRSAGSKKTKPEKTNWILHQYHLGPTEEETEGELVVCKVFYQKQPRQCTGPRAAEAATDMENVDLNQGSRDATTCVSSVSRGTPVSSKVDTPKSGVEGNGKMRGAVTHSSKGSELTVLGGEIPAAAASELSSNPAYHSNGWQAPTPDARNGSFANNGDAYCAEQEKAGQGFDFAADSQQQYPEEELACKEDFLESFFNIDNNPGFNFGMFNPEEPVISNPHEDYPHIDDIALNVSPPSLNLDYAFSSQEALALIELRPPSQDYLLSSQEAMGHGSLAPQPALNQLPHNPLDNDDSLSSTQ